MVFGTVGVPVSVPETEPPLPLCGVNVMPVLAGVVPDQDSVGVGVPVAVTVNEKPSLGATVSLIAEVKTGGVGFGFTKSVKFWVFVPAEFVAENVIG